MNVEIARRALRHGFFAAFAALVPLALLGDTQCEDFERAFHEPSSNGVDVMLCPTSPTAPFRLGEKTSDPLTMYLSDVFTVGANLAGLPGLSLNAGFSSEGLPLGVQLLGRPFEDERVLSAAFALEQELGLSRRRPSL